MKRRALLASAIVLLSGCNSQTGPAEFAMAKSYLDAAVGAVLAAAQQFLRSTPPPSTDVANKVYAIMADLQSLQATLDSQTDPTTWKEGANMAVGYLQQIVPMVAPMLGSAAPDVTVAIQVIQAFINGLPAPSNAPPTPPASLRRKAMEFRHG